MSKKQYSDDDYRRCREAVPNMIADAIREGRHSNVVNSWCYRCGVKMPGGGWHITLDKKNICRACYEGPGKDEVEAAEFERVVVPAAPMAAEEIVRSFRTLDEQNKFTMAELVNFAFDRRSAWQRNDSHA